jgi:hypothetical protein
MLYVKFDNSSLTNSYRIVPNYELAPDLQDINILRVVIRENMTEIVSLQPDRSSIILIST